MWVGQIVLPKANVYGNMDSYLENIVFNIRMWAYVHTHICTPTHMHTHTLAHTFSPPLVFRNILFRNEVLKSGTSCLELCGEMCLNFKETRLTCS